MTVMMIPSGEKAEYNDAYAARLIEQGRAVAVPPAPPKKAAPTANAEATEEAKQKKPRKK